MVIVPLPSGLPGVENVRSRAWMALVLAVAGVAPLSTDKRHGTVSSRSGKVLEMVSAMSFSFYIMRVVGMPVQIT